MTTMTDLNRQHRLALAGAAVAVLITIALALIGWRLHLTVLSSAKWVSHTQEVTRQLQTLLTLVTDAESGQRGFLLTGDDRYLAPYRAASATLDAELAEVARLTADNPSQRDRITRLAGIVHAKTAELVETLELARRGDRASALAVVLSHRGQTLMDEIRRTVHDAIGEEESLLAARTATLEGNIRRRGYLIWGLVAVNAGMILALVLAIRRLERLEPILTVCAWSKTILDGDEWISFEEYLARRFHIKVTHGMSPKEAAKIMTAVDQQAVFHRR